jgi:hypothetical protein
MQNLNAVRFPLVLSGGRFATVSLWFGYYSGHFRGFSGAPENQLVPETVLTHAATNMK